MNRSVISIPCWRPPTSAHCTIVYCLIFPSSSPTEHFLSLFPRTTHERDGGLLKMPKYRVLCRVFYDSHRIGDPAPPLRDDCWTMSGDQAELPVNMIIAISVVDVISRIVVSSMLLFLFFGVFPTRVGLFSARPELATS